MQSFFSDFFSSAVSSLTNEELANMIEALFHNETEHLLQFDWRWGQNMNVPSIVNILRFATNLQHLVLYKHTAFMDEDLIEICNHCPELVEINLRGCHLLTDKSIIRLSESCSKIKVLELRFFLFLYFSDMKKEDVINCQTCHLSTCQNAKKFKSWV
jgi:hypothetical protein